MYNKEHVWLTKPFFIQGPRAHEKKTDDPTRAHIKKTKRGLATTSIVGTNNRSKSEDKT